MTKTEWRATDDRWWPASVVAAAVGGTAALLVAALVFRTSPYWFSAPLLLGLLNLWAVSRSRMRLTSEGIEVRRIRTRTFDWADIESVQEAPEWDTSSPSIWLRLRGSVPTSAPEVLVLPGRTRRGGDGQTLDEIVALLQEHLERARPTSRTSET